MQYIDPVSPTTPVSLQELVEVGDPLDVYLGFGSSSPNTLSVGGFNYVTLMGYTEDTSPGDAPTVTTVDGGGAEYAETSVFIIDPTTGDITLTWVNPDTSAATDITLATDSTSVYMGSGSDYISPNSFTLVDSMTFVPLV